MTTHGDEAKMVHYSRVFRLCNHHTEWPFQHITTYPFFLLELASESCLDVDTWSDWDFLRLSPTESFGDSFMMLGSER